MPDGNFSRRELGKLLDTSFPGWVQAVDQDGEDARESVPYEGYLSPREARLLGQQYIAAADYAAMDRVSEGMPALDSYEVGAADPNYYEAPRVYERQDGDGPSVFLAGGITGVERWHDRALELLRERSKRFVVLNPNRANFPIYDPDAGAAQVDWEQQHLWAADVTLFWFPASDRTVTTQPIALLELGQALVPGSRRRIVVGADSGYPREADVHLFCQLHRPQMVVWSDLEDAIRAVVLETEKDVGA